MKQFLIMSVTCFSIGFGMAALFSHSLYRQDVRHCISQGNSEEFCETKFK